MEAKQPRVSQSEDDEEKIVRLGTQMGAMGTSVVESGDSGGRDLGRNDAPTHPQGLTGILNRDEAWTFVRRFNKQVFRVRVIDERPLTALDMNVAVGEDDASPERLRAHAERLYMVFVVDCFSFYKQIVRLRSWRETQRTMVFLAVYSLAWLLDLLTPTLTVFVMALIVCPRARYTCFPPAPPSLINSATGRIQKPLAGELASDSITGAPEKHPGEAIEQEAHNFVTSIGKLMMGVGSGNPLGEDGVDSVLNPSKVVDNIAEAQDRCEAQDPDETREPVSRAVDSFEIFPAIRVLPDFIDSWERFRNALSPTLPFPLHRARMTLAACLLPLLVVLCLATWHTIMKGLGVLFGLGFFGGPLMPRCAALIDTMFPGWRKYTELRHTVFRRVPTNAQLTVALLRAGERSKFPLPPPPSKHDRPNRPKTVDGQHLEYLGTPKDEIQAAIDPAPDHDEGHDRSKHGGKARTARRLADVLKRTTKNSVRTVLKMDQARAWAGGAEAKDRLGALSAPGRDGPASPVRFPTRYRGERGCAYITTTATSPALSWRGDAEDLASAWTVALADVTELRKVGGLGWKSRFVVGAVLGWQVADGLVVKTREGRELHLTAVLSRDAMFNRLISLGGQMWEVF